MLLRGENKMEHQCYIYPTKKQRIRFEEIQLIENPTTEEDAQHNKTVQERIKRIEEVF